MHKGPALLEIKDEEEDEEEDRNESENNETANIKEGGIIVPVSTNENKKGLKKETSENEEIKEEEIQKDKNDEIEKETAETGNDKNEVLTDEIDDDDDGDGEENEIEDDKENENRMNLDAEELAKIKRERIHQRKKKKIWKIDALINKIYDGNPSLLYEGDLHLARIKKKEREEIMEIEKGIKIGDWVILEKDKRIGIVKYYGPCHFTYGNVYGIEFQDGNMGTNTGDFDNVKYFECKNNKGIFVKIDAILKKTLSPAEKKARAAAKKKGKKSPRPTKTPEQKKEESERKELLKQMVFLPCFFCIVFFKKKRIKKIGKM